MLAADSRSGTISPTPPPVNGTDSATMRNTSANASVTSAKYEPLRP